ncbi:MAG: YbaN family protein [Acidobacteriota bacterium]
MWAAAGWLFLSLGALGVPLPLLPTTPFLLLATACFLRGSPRLHAWMMSNRVFGSYLRDYRAGLGVPATTKASAIGLLWLGIGLSIGLWVQVMLVRVVLLLIATAVTVHILLIPTKHRSFPGNGTTEAGDGGRPTAADAREREVPAPITGRVSGDGPDHRAAGSAGAGGQPRPG